MTRATLAALRGDLREAVHLHPLAPIIVPLLFAYGAVHAIAYVRHGFSDVDRIWSSRWLDRALIALFVAMIALWVARFFGAFGGPAPV
jgi:hypothetical protein